MRTPNPPLVLLTDLDQDQMRLVVRLALSVVKKLAAGKDWDAYSDYKIAALPLPLHIAFWSLLDSQERSTIQSLSHAENNHDQ